LPPDESYGNCLTSQEFIQVFRIGTTDCPIINSLYKRLAYK